MLDRDCADVPGGVKIKHRVLIKITCLCHRRIAKLDEQRIGAGKVANSHASNRRSKNALCTVSPSASRTTEGSDFPFRALLSSAGYGHPPARARGSVRLLPAQSTPRESAPDPGGCG